MQGEEGYRRDLTREWCLILIESLLILAWQLLSGFCARPSSFWSHSHFFSLFCHFSLICNPSSVTTDEGLSSLCMPLSFKNDDDQSQCHDQKSCLRFLTLLCLYSWNCFLWPEKKSFTVLLVHFLLCWSLFRRWLGLSWISFISAFGCEKQRMKGPIIDLDVSNCVSNRHMEMVFAQNFVQKGVYESHCLKEYLSRRRGDYTWKNTEKVKEDQRRVDYKSKKERSSVSFFLNEKRRDDVKRSRMTKHCDERETTSGCSFKRRSKKNKNRRMLSFLWHFSPHFSRCSQANQQLRQLTWRHSKQFKHNLLWICVCVPRLLCRRCCDG